MYVCMYVWSDSNFGWASWSRPSTLSVRAHRKDKRSMSTKKSIKTVSVWWVSRNKSCNTCSVGQWRAARGSAGVPLVFHDINTYLLIIYAHYLIDRTSNSYKHFELLEFGWNCAYTFVDVKDHSSSHLSLILILQVLEPLHVTSHHKSNDFCTRRMSSGHFECVFYFLVFAEKYLRATSSTLTRSPTSWADNNGHGTTNWVWLGPTRSVNLMWLYMCIRPDEDTTNTLCEIETGRFVCN